ncbi:MAG: pyridoxamine 5'-phosphate oxidase [Bacteroidota bacterium]
MIKLSKTAQLRIVYADRPLDEAVVDQNPIVQFNRWFEEAIAAKVPYPNAMSLATATREGKPSVRIVLLKHADAHGFVFYSNYDSRKGDELSRNAHASLAFFWAELERQVRIEGEVKKISERESDEYFQSRPRGSQIGAWASRQGDVLTSRKELEREFKRLERQYDNKPVQRPPHWGGYRLEPNFIEFWQGRPNRLHDRIIYTLQNGDNWKISRLAP